MPTIYVSRQGNSTKLSLRDSEGNGNNSDQITTLVNASDTVTWEIDPTPPPGSNSISSIINIYKKMDNNPNNVSVLTANPSNLGNNLFQGTVVSPSPGSGKSESYSIDYQLTNGGNTLTDDPKLQMN